MYASEFFPMVGRLRLEEVYAIKKLEFKKVPAGAKLTVAFTD